MGVVLKAFGYPDRRAFTNGCRSSFNDNVAHARQNDVDLGGVVRVAPWRGSRAHRDFGNSDRHFIGRSGVAAEQFPPAHRSAGRAGPFFGRTLIYMANDHMAKDGRFHSRTVPRQRVPVSIIPSQLCRLSYVLGLDTMAECSHEQHNY